MEGDSKAIVRIGLLDIAKKSRTMVYEDGVWLQELTDELAANFEKPVEQWACSPLHKMPRRVATVPPANR